MLDDPSGSKQKQPRNRTSDKKVLESINLGELVDLPFQNQKKKAKKFEE